MRSRQVTWMSERTESVVKRNGTGIPTAAHSVNAPWTMPTYAGSHPSRCVAGCTHTRSAVMVRFTAQTEANGPIVARVRNSFLRPTSYSSVQ